MCRVLYLYCATAQLQETLRIYLYMCVCVLNRVVASMCYQQLASVTIVMYNVADVNVNRCVSLVFIVLFK